MNLSINLLNRPKNQETANTVARTLMENAKQRDLNVDVVVTVFDSPAFTSQILRNQFFKRYNRLEIDVEAHDRAFDDSETLSRLLRSTLYHGLLSIGHQNILFSSESMDILPVRVSSKSDKGHGIILLSIFRKDSGFSPEKAFSVLTEWFSKRKSKSVFIDGEIEVDTDGLHVYFSSNSRNFPAELCAFVKIQFSGNSVMILNADGTIACEW